MRDFYRIHLEDSRRRSERMCPAYRCELCRASQLHGAWPHLCREVTYGTAVMPTVTLPFRNESESESGGGSGGGAVYATGAAPGLLRRPGAV